MALSRATGNEAALEADVSALASLDLEQLREVWRGRFGAPPRLRSRDLMRRCLAERMQQAWYGVDTELERKLTQLAKGYRPGKQRPKKDYGKVRPGTVLLREWRGETHRVEVTKEGFVWKGKLNKSLSAIAKEITGAHWNGPRFFAVRPDKGEGKS